MNQRNANEMNEDAVFDMAKRVFAAQPFTVLLGAELVEAGAGFATIALPLRDVLKQQHGFAHGGVVSYLADNALTFAGGLALGGDDVRVTVRSPKADMKASDWEIEEAELRKEMDPLGKPKQEF